MLHWGRGEWEDPHDAHSTRTALGIDYVDIEVGTADCRPVRFTFYWKGREQWEGREFAVTVR